MKFIYVFELKWNFVSTHNFESSGKCIIVHFVSTLSWNPDDNQLLTCGLEEVVRSWDVNSGKCIHVYEKQGLGLVSCGWFSDGKGVISGITDKSICMWDMDGRELECWKGQRTLKISDMAINNDGKRILSICRETAILIIDREEKFERLIEEDQVITSFSLSKDNRFLLINLLNQEIHLWSIEDDPKVISMYRGHKRTLFVIRSCFGGFEQAFIAIGSEDSQVHIWHRATEELLLVLPGHSGAVSCVSWNPTNPHMLASASDDRTIRIWGLQNMNLKLKGAAHSNGVIHHPKWEDIERSHHPPIHVKLYSPFPLLLASLAIKNRSAFAIFAYEKNTQFNLTLFSDGVTNPLLLYKIILNYTLLSLVAYFQCLDHLLVGTNL